jgi:hypothetical protein
MTYYFYSYFLGFDDEALFVPLKNKIKNKKYSPLFMPVMTETR